MEQNDRYVVAAHFKNKRCPSTIIIAVLTKPRMSKSSVMNAHFAQSLVDGANVHGDSGRERKALLRAEYVEGTRL